MDDSPVFEKEVAMVLKLHFLDASLAAMLVIRTVMDSDEASKETDNAEDGEKQHLPITAFTPLLQYPARQPG